MKPGDTLKVWGQRVTIVRIEPEIVVVEDATGTMRELAGETATGLMKYQISKPKPKPKPKLKPKQKDTKKRNKPKSTSVWTIYTPMGGQSGYRIKGQRRG